MDSLKKRGWKECDEENNWDIFWAEKEWINDIMDNLHLGHNQKVNHFRNHLEVYKLYEAYKKRSNDQKFEKI